MTRSEYASIIFASKILLLALLFPYDAVSGAVSAFIILLFQLKPMRCVWINLNILYTDDSRANASLYGNHPIHLRSQA